MNLGKVIYTIIMIIVTLAVLTGLYPTFAEYVDNVTGSGFTGTAILAIAKSLYWIIAGAVVLLEFLVGMGLMSLVKTMNRLK